MTYFLAAQASAASNKTAQRGSLFDDAMYNQMEMGKEMRKHAQDPNSPFSTLLEVDDAGDLNYRGGWGVQAELEYEKAMMAEEMLNNGRKPDGLDLPEYMAPLL